MGDLNYSFVNGVGRAPAVGEGIAFLNNGLTLSYSKYFYDGAQWLDEALNPVAPNIRQLAVGEAAWFGFGANFSMTVPVPEPGVLAFAISGALLFIYTRRDRHAI